VVEFARQLAQAHESFANQLRQAAHQLVDDRYRDFSLVLLLKLSTYPVATYLLVLVLVDVGHRSRSFIVPHSSSRPNDS